MLLKFWTTRVFMRKTVMSCLITFCLNKKRKKSENTLKSHTLQVAAKTLDFKIHRVLLTIVKIKLI